MNLLLDTHAILWFCWDDPRLTTTARTAIVEPSNRKFVSTASCWEIAVKVSVKKLTLGEPYREFIEQHLDRNNFELLPIEHKHIERIIDMPFHHRDPFDRMLVAQSHCENTPIVSGDEQLDAYAIPRIW